MNAPTKHPVNSEAVRDLAWEAAQFDHTGEAHEMRRSRDQFRALAEYLSEPHWLRGIDTDEWSDTDWATCEQALKEMGVFCGYSATAQSARLAGRISKATDSECRAERAYDRLPKAWRW